MSDYNPSDWRPGDLAMVTVASDPAPVLGFRDGDMGCYGWSLGEYRAGAIWIADDHVVHVRRLVAIDPESAPKDNHCPIQQTLRDVAYIAGPREFKVLRWLADQIEEQTKPEKPEEPTGLGAVVRDADDRTWVRYLRPGTSAPWLWSEAPPECERLSVWSAIPAVEVLSAGVDIHTGGVE